MSVQPSESRLCPSTFSGEWQFEQVCKKIAFPGPAGHSSPPGGVAAWVPAAGGVDAAGGGVEAGGGVVCEVSVDAASNKIHPTKQIPLHLPKQSFIAVSPEKSRQIRDNVAKMRSFCYISNHTLVQFRTKLESRPNSRVFERGNLPSPILTATSISKSFEGVRALKGVSFELLAGENHALIGENGAGKSTLIKIMTGAVSADSGSLVINGHDVPHNSPSIARRLGVAAIYQQPSLFPHLNVAENIALALEEASAWRRVDWKERRALSLSLLLRAGAAIDPERLASTLSMPEQQIVEIAKAIGANARILIMDEPTASLTDREVQSLFNVIAELKSHGVGIVYISHRLEEISRIADRITVLRDGEVIATRHGRELDRAELIQLMVGRSVNAVFPKKKVELGDVLLEVRNLSSRAAGVTDISLQVRKGEILGVAGLVGSGRTQLAETIFGLTPADAGEIIVGGKPVEIHSPAAAIAQGIAYVPEDRRKHGIVLELPISANTSLADLNAVSHAGLIDSRAEDHLADRFIGQLRIKAPSPHVVTGTLSGGNQQKVALSRWLATNPKVLILDEPTQGVDVGSKSEIHALMGDLAERGMAIIMISSELPEVLGMSDRIAVMRGGKLAGILPREEATQEKVLSLAFGHVPASEVA
jgi:rhamnose transport system ATP-binding protein